RVVSLIEILGTFSITVKELKRLFSLLKPEGDFRPANSPHILKALQFMAFSRVEGPDAFFNFDGRTSGIMIPESFKWPNSKGVSFCTWLRIEGFDDLEGKPNYNPRLWSFFTESGNGVELGFASKQLVLQTVIGQDRKGYAFND